MESTQKLQNGKFSLHKEVELPIDGLPELVQQYINEIVRVYHCPIEFPTVAVIAAFATAIGKRIKVTDGKYTNPLMLWFINVAPSGSNKTQPVKEVLKPLREINRKNYQVFDAEYRAWKADKERDESNPPMFNQILVSLQMRLVTKFSKALLRASLDTIPNSKASWMIRNVIIKEATSINFLDCLIMKTSISIERVTKSLWSLLTRLCVSLEIYNQHCWLRRSGIRNIWSAA